MLSFKILSGSPFSLRVGSSRSSRRNHSDTHGKTRSFDRDDHGFSGIRTRDSSSVQKTSSTEETHKSLASRVASMEMNTATESRDSVDAVHPRINNYGFNSPKPTSPILEEHEITSASALKSKGSAFPSAKFNNLKNKSSEFRKEMKTSTNGSSGLFVEEKRRGINGHTEAGRRSASPFLGDLVVDGDGIGTLPIHTQGTLTITSEYGDTPLKRVTVQITGKAKLNVVYYYISLPFVKLTLFYRSEWPCPCESS